MSKQARIVGANGSS